MFSYLRKGVEKEQIKRRAQEGYPIERTPYVHPIMNLAVDSKAIKYEQFDMLKLTLAAEGSDIVKTKSLEMIRTRLCQYYKLNPLLENQVQEPFPKNTIAVSFSTPNFEIGQTSSEFKLWAKFEMPENAYFSYQRVSEYVQASYYNEGGKEFLAGICYYPVAHGMPKLLGVDLNLINLTILGGIDYPLRNRKDQLNFTKYKNYGRYCETAGKRVLVSFNNKAETVRHRTLNCVTNKTEYKECKECADDFVSYKFEDSALIDPTSIFPALRLLKTIGIGLAELNCLSGLPMDSKVPMTHSQKESAEPQLRDIVQFAMLNPSWTIDKDFVSQLSIPTGRADFAVDVISVVHKETGVMRLHSESPKVSELGTWLDANPDFNVHRSSALVATLVLGIEYDTRIGGENVVGSSEAAEVAASFTIQEDLADESPDELTSSEDSDIEHVEEDKLSSGEDFEMIH